MKISVIGATGYAGAELVKLLFRHKGFEIASLTSESYAGKKISEVYPAFAGLCDKVLSENDIETEGEKADAFFLCLPHKTAMDTAKALYDKGKIVIDLSADFRVADAGIYEKAYKTTHTAKELLDKAAYGQPELFGERVKAARLVAAPGCYPTSVIVPLYPLLEKGVVDKDFIIADSKSGVSGAGRKPSASNSFCETNEDFKPYGIFSHRHNSEMDYILSKAAGQVNVTFTPHLLPVNRGILSTIYLKTGLSAEEIVSLWRERYAGHKLVRIREEAPAIKDVAFTSFIDMAVFKNGDKAVIVSAIDNLLKGASAQALQCLNLIAGYPEEEGLI